jgi:hypothetical protein
MIQPVKTITREKVKIDPSGGMIKIDGMNLCKKVIRNGVTYLQFKDRDAVRSNCRHACLIEISLDELVGMIESVALLD